MKGFVLGPEYHFPGGVKEVLHSKDTHFLGRESGRGQETALPPKVLVVPPAGLQDHFILLSFLKISPYMRTILEIWEQLSFGKVVHREVKAGPSFCYTALFVLSLGCPADRVELTWQVLECASLLTVGLFPTWHLDVLISQT